MKQIPIAVKLFAVLLILGIISNAMTQIQKGKTRPLMTKQWMEKISSERCCSKREQLCADGRWSLS